MGPIDLVEQPPRPSSPSVPTTPAVKSETPSIAQSSGADSVISAPHASPHLPERQAELLPRRGGEKRHPASQQVAREGRHARFLTSDSLLYPLPNTHSPLRVPGEPSALQEAGRPAPTAAVLTANSGAGQLYNNDHNVPVATSVTWAVRARREPHSEGLTEGPAHQSREGKQRKED